ncbi:MAG: tryptophan-rich sensory protein [Candidatus Diapherotrites archaeon]|uniref:Tryptophan-rich sensory protein n=1 Tax=Candidatus Iainarchaeum sp. TaxID=3101447 RepID=A0A8T4KVZ7_9ARCH|nr:tryptophan-rich sensory protein [Candidatus Diapherotrites archaeon]
MKAGNIAKLIGSIALCEFAGVIGSIFTFPAIATWYASLQKPFFSPQNWVFAPVWTALYFLMGIALYLVIKKGIKGRNAKIAVSAFAVQLVLNALWSFLFFGLKSPLYSFVEIIALWIAIAATIIAFSKISKRAALLLVPYILWTSFAAVLNFSIMALNP